MVPLFSEERVFRATCYFFWQDIPSGQQFYGPSITTFDQQVVCIQGGLAQLPKSYAATPEYNVDGVTYATNLFGDLEGAFEVSISGLNEITMSGAIVRDNPDIIRVFTACPTANSPPDCASAQAAAPTWPPNHKMQSISVQVSDVDGDDVTVTYTAVHQNEPTSGLGQGDTCPDAYIGNEGESVKFLRERSGLEAGRVYTVSFTADDGNGGTCDGSVRVCVPHDYQGTCDPLATTTVDSLSCPESF